MGFTASKQQKVTDGVRRILPRHRFEARVKIEVVRGRDKVVVEGWARDLSESGLGAFVGTPLLLGELASVRIPLGDGGELALPAKVTRNVGTEYGFQFTALSREQREQISGLVAKTEIVPLNTQQ